jgi:hypothetical protein
MILECNMAKINLVTGEIVFPGWLTKYDSIEELVPSRDTLPVEMRTPTRNQQIIAIFKKDTHYCICLHNSWGNRYLIRACAQSLIGLIQFAEEKGFEFVVGVNYNTVNHLHAIDTLYTQLIDYKHYRPHPNGHLQTKVF